MDLDPSCSPLRSAAQCSPARAPTPNHLPPIDCSSPSRPAFVQPDGGALRLSLPLDTTLHFGRKAKKPARLATKRGDKTLPVLLPKSAKNASRVHCTVEVLPLAEADAGEAPRRRRRVVVRVEVMGQNGMKVDGRLLKCGEVAQLERKLGRDVELEFWGWTALVKVGGTRAERGELPRRGKRSARAAEALEEADDDNVPARAPTPRPMRASTPVSAASFVARRARAHTPALPRASTPALPPGATKWDRQFAKRQQQEDDEAEDFVKSSAQPTLRLAASSTAYSAASSPLPQGPSSPSSLSALPSPARAPSHAAAADPALAIVSSLSLDLPGMLASAIVFHHRSTVPVSDLIRDMLQTTLGMWDVLPGGKGAGSAPDEERAVAAWWDAVEAVLRGAAFFGCIENAGLKDAAGNPLLPEFFYVPEKDQNADRVEALEPFVKRVRASRTAGGGTRYFWRRPTTKKNK